MGTAKVEYYGRTLIDLTGDSVNPDVLAEGETAHDANGDLIVGKGVLNKGNFANALVGNVSGEVVAIDDVSPLEHKIRVKLSSENLADNTEVTVKSCGKNLIPFPYRDLPAGAGTKTVNGVTFTIHDDGTITTSGTSTSQSYFNLKNLFLPVGTYRLSGCIGSMPQGAFIYFANKDYSVYKTMYGSGITIEVTKADIYDIVVNFNNGVVADGLVFKPQLEIGTTTTDHEPYIEGETITTTLAEGAELTSIAPNMTIYTDKAGAIVECSYNKDTNIVIEKLTQAIIALGGNV